MNPSHKLLNNFRTHKLLETSKMQQLLDSTSTISSYTEATLQDSSMEKRLAALVKMSFKLDTSVLKLRRTKSHSFGGDRSKRNPSCVGGSRSKNPKTRRGKLRRSNSFGPEDGKRFVVRTKRVEAAKEDFNGSGLPAMTKAITKSKSGITAAA